MADHFQKISAKVMNWWPYILLNFVLFHFVYATPVNTPMQLPGYPQQIHYVGDKPLPGGQLQSLLNGNFTPDQIVTGSGPAGNSAFTGTAGGFSLLGNSVVKAGEALGSLCSSLVTGTEFPRFDMQKNMST